MKFASSKGTLIGIAQFIVCCVRAGLPDPAKRMACVITTYCILITVVRDRGTAGHPIIDFLSGIAMANVFQLLALLFPPSRFVLTSFSSRLESLGDMQVSLLHAYKEAFTMREDVHVSIVEHLLEEMRNMIQSLKADLPAVKMESLLFHGSTVAYDSSMAYLKEVDEHMEYLQGMRLALAKMTPSRTHQLYLQFLQHPIEGMADQCIAVVQAASKSVRSSVSICSSHHRNVRGLDTMIHAGLFDSPSMVAREVQLYLVRARAAIVYSVGSTDILAIQISSNCSSGFLDGKSNMNEEQEPDSNGYHHQYSSSRPPSRPPSLAAVAAGTDSILDQSPPPPIPTWRRGSDTTFLVYMRDYERMGYSLNLPRNSFILSFILYAQTLKRLEAFQDVTPSTRLGSFIKQSLGLRSISSTTGCITSKFKWIFEPVKLRQPLKVGLAVAISSVFVLLNSAQARMGPLAIWAVIALCQTLSPYPSSSFRTGLNRIQGTVFGCVYAMATLDWFEVRHSAWIVIAITLWVFVCNYCRLSPSYGEVSAIAATTAPIIILGPGPVDTRAMQRIEHIILGVVLYVIIDMAIYPVRAKLLLRNDLAASIANFASLWQSTLSIFLQRKDRPTPEQVDELWQCLRVALRREETYISLAAGEPELLHKPFQASAYRDVVLELREVSRYMSLLWRSTVSFPDTMPPKDREMLVSIQRAVMKLEEPTKAALLDAQAAVTTMTKCRARSGTRKRYALLGLRAEYIAMQEFVEDYMKELLMQNRSTKEDFLVLTSPGFILNLNAMLFNLMAIGSGLLRLGHATRKLVELEKANYYTIRKAQ